MSKDKHDTILDSICKNMRRGTYIILQARTKAHYQSIMSVFKTRRYWNEDMVTIAKELNKLSDEDFAVELVRAKKIVGKNYHRRRVTDDK